MYVKSYPNTVSNFNSCSSAISLIVFILRKFSSCNETFLSVIAGGCNIEGEEDAYDFGSGAGFYVDATEEKWKTNYRMYSYVTKELRTLVDKYFNTSGKQSITGHRYVVP